MLLKELYKTITTCNIWWKDTKGGWSILSLSVAIINTRTASYVLGIVTKPFILHQPYDIINREPSRIILQLNTANIYGKVYAWLKMKNSNLRSITAPFWRLIWNFYDIIDLWKTTTRQQRPQYLNPKGCRCTQVWLNCTCILSFDTTWKIEELL